MLNRVINFFTSLRLTVVCLVLALGLVFVGTLAQVKWGLYAVQEGYFGSWFVLWQPKGWALKIPVWPGGLLLGTVLLVNLIAAHIKRFEISRKKFGIFIIHAGLILLLLGQLCTQMFQVESFMRIPEGDTTNYSESHRFSELAVVDTTDPKSDYVVSIPEKIVAKKGEISDPALPFKVRVKEYYRNSDPEMGGKPGFAPKPYTLDQNKQNFPAAVVEVETDAGTKGPFPVSWWTSEPQWKDILERAPNFGPRFTAPQTFSYKGRTYEVALRPVRYYKPYSIKLLDFTHEQYAGTDIPKNFSSRVRLTRPETKEDRQVLIYMNNPLRYDGETYYQGSFEPGDHVSILQVVRNPGWLTPYIACTMVGAGLLIQFLSHLVGFSKRKTR